MEEAIEKGLQMEAWQIEEDKKHGVTKVRMAVEYEQLRIIKNFQEKVEELLRNCPEIKCFNCCTMGHMEQRQRRCHLLQLWEERPLRQQMPISASTRFRK